MPNSSIPNRLPGNILPLMKNILRVQIKLVQTASLPVQMDNQDSVHVKTDGALITEDYEAGDYDVPTATCC